ncbi:MAG TPA: hypothetical protein VFE32_19785 [Puia sp.]|nr:hypothetical protein [Puia sp.]
MCGEHRGGGVDQDRRDRGVGRVNIAAWADPDREELGDGLVNIAAVGTGGPAVIAPAVLNC